jgi:hypothetical protein
MLLGMAKDFDGVLAMRARPVAIFSHIRSLLYRAIAAFCSSLRNSLATRSPRVALLIFSRRRAFLLFRSQRQ